MRISGGQLVTLSLAGVVLTGCSESTPTRPLVSSPTTVAAVHNPPSAGSIIIFKKSNTTSLRSARVGSRLGNLIGTGASSSAQDAVITSVIPHFNAIAVSGTVSASDVGGDVTVVPNYIADMVDPVPSEQLQTMPIEMMNDPLGTDQSGASLFAANWQWDMKRISVNRAWVPSRGGAGSKVCIIDSGIDPGHVVFVGKSITSTSFVTNSAAQTDTNGHGSHVAGTVSTNGVGLSSVVPNASLMTAKVFAGSGGASTTAVWNGILWCADNGADVINMSLGFTGGIPVAGNEDFIAFYQEVLDYASDLGVVIVAAAGNDGVTMPVAGRIFIPAEMGRVTSVAATGPTGNFSPCCATATWAAPGAGFDGIASYSNRGPVPSVDISAPGGDFATGWPNQSLITSVCSRQFRSGNTFPCAGGGSVLFEAGTSQASPHVAGVAALIRARWPSTVRSVTLRNKIESCLYRAVDNVGSTSIFGRGRLNAYKAATQAC